MSETIARQIAMLRAIPREPQRISVHDLRTRLASQGYEITARSIQRDLNELSRHFGMTCEIEGKTQLWYFPKGVRSIDVPGMGAAEALVLRMAELHLSTALPAGQLEHLAPLFQRAREFIEQTDIPLSTWRKRVRVIHRGPPLAVPRIQDGVAEAVHEGLIRRRKVRIRYRRRGDKALRDYEASIHALVVREGVVYAVTTLWDYRDLLHLALHRASSAELLEAPSTQLRDFDVDAYIDSQAAFSYPDGPSRKISLALRVSEHVAEHLLERPIAADQMASRRSDGAWDIAATVMDTRELRWWLLGFGSAVEVVRPAALRKAMAEDIARMHTLYSATPKT